ncbi:MAG: response regulator transcription factor [Chloroflexota bacterium]|nr:response regulator transcription factor [Chloroflexota bacterium]
MEKREQSEPIQTRVPLILIVEDDQDARTIYSDHLTYNGYRTLVAASGEEALALAKAHPPDVALVDVRLPGMSGQEMTAWLKEHQPEVKIILITAFGSTELAVEEMHRGAFYYLTKPVRPSRVLEVVEEAWAAYRASAQVRVGDLVVDLREGRATVEGEAVPLTLQESKLLVCLVRRRGREASYEELWQEVWDYTGPPDKGLIQRAVSNLRRKVGQGKIKCVWGRGYRLG